MTLFRNKYRIESTRLPGYDYSQPGAYYVTVITHERQCLFGEVHNGTMVLNISGEMVKVCWSDIPNHFPNARLDEFIIMPDHVHGIIVLDGERDEKMKCGGLVFNVETNDYSSLQNSKTPFRSPSKTIGSMIRGFKIGVTKWFRANTQIYTIWQPRFYDHIIRNEESLNRIRQYIIDNPMRWISDDKNPEKINNPLLPQIPH